MVEAADREVLVASLRGYLEELLETGVMELPFGGDSGAPEVAVPRPAAVASAPAAAPSPAAAAPAPAFEPGPAESAGSLRCHGDAAAPLAFVMTGNGYDGEAGELLAKMIQAMKFTCDEVYLVCFDQSAPPSREALLSLLHTADREAVVALGASAAHLLLATDAPLPELRGSFSALEGAPVMPTWHPEILVTNQALKRDAWNDLQQVMRRLGQGRR